MKRNHKTPWAGRIAGLALLACAAAAHAQYVWIDDKGLKHFSDRPPPPSVPIKRILKAPNLTLMIDSPGAAAAEAAPTTAERNADFNKRKGEQAEQARKAGEEAQRQRDLAANCEANRKHKAQLESGARISTFEANGEQGFLSDEARARQLAAAQRALSACK
ncbi:MAG: DUF4124 domain-containing protein [Burkholderiaceae bacterium]|nr:DUF4124 domain-containing protein [Burkholderiaceae bacterium]